MTYPLPALLEAPRLWAATWRRLSRPLARPLAAIAAVNALSAAFVTHREATEFYRLLETRHRQRRRRELDSEPGELTADS